jgi:membrane protein
LGGAATAAVQVTRWLFLIVMVVVSLAVVYRIAPEQAEPKIRWVSVGAGVATALWILGTLLFSVYINLFSHYNVTYGALTGVIVLMLWLFLSCYIVLLGAEINRESERQIAYETTPTALAPRSDTAQIETNFDAPLV